MLIALLFTPYESAAYTWVTPLVFAVLQIVLHPDDRRQHRAPPRSACTSCRSPAAGSGRGAPSCARCCSCLVVPALVWDSDQRGFHDKVAGTVLIRA